MKLPRAVFRYVEHELYHYDQTLEDISELQRDVAESQMAAEFVSPLVQSGRISDPTFRKANRLILSSALARMVKTAKAIERALSRLPDGHQELYRLKYRQGCSPQEMCDKLHIELSTYYKWRREVVHMAALEMGLVIVGD